MHNKIIEFVIENDGEFLMAVPYRRSSSFARWSVNKYDAVRLPSESVATMIAKRLGGKVLRFDRFTGELW